MEFFVNLTRLRNPLYFTGPYNTKQGTNFLLIALFSSVLSHDVSKNHL